MNSKSRFHWCMVCMLALAVAGCKVKRPDDVISETKMENLLYDYHLAKSMGDNASYNENYKKALYIDAVFKKYGVTEAEFDSSMVWYTRNTEVLSKIYDKVRERLKGEQERVNDLIAKRDKKPKTTQPGDSVDVWPWQRMQRITGEYTDTRYAFVLPTDSNYKERDTLVWEVRYHFLQPAATADRQTAVMAMQVVYEKDTLSRWIAIGESGIRRIRLYADTLGQMKEIKGFLYYSAEGEKQTGALLADRFSLMRYHCQDTLPFAVRDSLNKAMALQDSLKKVAGKGSADSLQRVPQAVKEEGPRLTPEEMNRRRTGGQREKKPEQIKVEQHIREERMEQQRERQLQNQRRQQQRRRTQNH